MEQVFTNKSYGIEFGITINGLDDFKIPKPLWCPYCSAFEDGVKIRSLLQERGEKKALGIVVYECTHCKNFYAVHYEIDRAQKAALFGGLYPERAITYENSVIEQCSPRFINLYSQALTSVAHGDIEIAAVGMRSALEVLVKDYALNELKKPIDEIRKKSLCDAVGDYLDQKDLVAAADVVRILGNDYTHYERKYPQLDFELLEKYMDIFIKLVETKLLLAHPPVSRFVPQVKE